MIPWHKFKTPHDAYLWAKAATSTHMLATCPKTGDSVLLGVSFAFFGITYAVEGRSGRHGIITAHDIQQHQAKLRP